MAVLKVYNDEQVIELLNDDIDTENPYDSWLFEGNSGLTTDRTLFLLVRENGKKFWKSIHIFYDMDKDKFCIDNRYHEEYFEIELNDDDDIFKYFMIDTDEIFDFQEMLKR